MNPVEISLGVLEALQRGLFYTVFQQMRPTKWQVCETTLGQDPEGDDWEPFSSTDVNGQTWIQWRKPA